MSPVRISSMALDLPTARISLCVPPTPGMVPSLISGWPNFASSEAMMMSQDIASSQPPPRAKPLTAAMTGLRIAETPDQCASMLPRLVSAKQVLVFISLMSAPAAKALPVPVTTAARTLSSASTSWSFCTSSRISPSESAFKALGLFRVSTAIAESRFSRSTSSSPEAALKPRTAATQGRRGCWAAPAPLSWQGPARAAGAASRRQNIEPTSRGGGRTVLVAAHSS
mmetsp:Transcript_14833/g.42524  ORF Transcript_14833/g.42524 Transcript_14833/m.42524 type:complete len:226 (+) Transcript_14833:443-1120(+)